MAEDDKKNKPVKKKEAPKKEKDLSFYEQAQLRNEQAQVSRKAREAKNEAEINSKRTEEYYDAGGDLMYQTFEGGKMTGKLTPEEAEEQGLVLNGEIVDERKKKAESGQSVDYGFDNSTTTAEKLLNESSFMQERYIVVINGVAISRTFLVR